MKAKTKRICSVLLILAMLVGLLPTVALAAEPATDTADFTGNTDTAITTLGGSSVAAWNDETNTLTLNGVNFETSAATAVKLPDGAKIVLNGENTIKGGSGSDCHGIWGVGSLTIQGTGTLAVTSGTAGNLSFGIRAETGVTIKGGAVDATGGTAVNQSFGIYTLSGDLTIEGGHVKANGGDAKESSGLWAANGSLVISGGKVVAKGGNVSGTSSGIFAKNVVIKNTDNRTPDVTTRGGEARYSRGIYIVNSGSLTISGGTLIAVAEYALSKAPAELPSAYNWRISGSGTYDNSPGTAYSWDSSHTYVEIQDTTSAYTVRFNANGGSGTMADDPGVYGTYTLPANGFTAPAGKQFKGWATSADGEVISGPITVDSDTTLYAIWEDIPAPTYTVTFDVNGENAIVAPASGTTNAAGKLTSLPTPTRSGYTFKEWNTKQDGSGTKVDENYVFSANTTVYAKWEAPTYTVSFAANGGTGTMESVPGISGEYTLPENGFTAPEGQQFKAWGVGGVEKAVGDKITVAADTTVTAVWENIPASTNPITADSSENGDVTISPKNAAKGDTVTLTIVPDQGYTLETLTVTDKDGNEIELTRKDDGAYTFTMPASEVTVEATFMEDNSMLNFFVDVPVDSFYYDAVLWAAKKGITIGVDATHFAPKDSCTRAQAVTFLWRAAGSPAPQGGKTPFTDVVKGSFYETAVLWAMEKGITNGTSATKFSPDAPCDRAQFATLLWRAQGKPAAGTTNPFTDVEEDAYYTDAVLWAVKNGITKGTSATTFSPHNNCSRAEAVTFLYRFFVK